jgi:hypothetical protein
LTNDNFNSRQNDPQPGSLPFPFSSPYRLDDTGKPKPDSSPFFLFQKVTVEEKGSLDGPALLSPFAKRLSTRLDTVKTQQDSESINASKLYRRSLSSYLRSHSLSHLVTKREELNRLSRRNQHRSLQILTKRQLSEKGFLL